MKKTDIISGSILEIPLDKGFGYGYVKIIFLQDVKPDCRLDQAIIKPYNIFRKDPLPNDEFKSALFETDDLLLFPLLLNGFPKIRGDKKWVLKGNSALTDEDKIIPDFIDLGFMKPLTRESIRDACNSEYGCRVIVENDKGFEYVNSFERIQHLGKWQHVNPDGIRLILTMTWMKKHNEDISSYYTQSDIDDNFWIPFAYREVVESDIEFSSSKFPGRLNIKK